MAIEDNKVYGLKGSQVQELADKVNSTGGLSEDTTFWGQTVSNGAVSGTLNFEDKTHMLIEVGNYRDAGLEWDASNRRLWIRNYTGKIRVPGPGGDPILFATSLDMDAHRITNLLAGTASTHAVNKSQLDALEARVAALEEVASGGGRSLYVLYERSVLCR